MIRDKQKITDLLLLIITLTVGLVFLIGCRQSQSVLPDVYTVNYDSNNTDNLYIPEDQNQYIEGETVTVLAYQGELVTTGYAFKEWNTTADGSGTAYREGDTFAMEGSDVTLYAQFSFFLKKVPGSLTFFTEPADGETATIDNDYWIGQTEVTYQLWSTVREWALNNGYSISGNGSPGSYYDNSSLHPVTFMTWRDAMVWCNALTEWFNEMNDRSLICVYYSDSGYQTPIRRSTDSDSVDYPNPGSEDDPCVKADANGFRLPLKNEWELAARYINDANGDGDIMDSGEYYPGNHVSGDTSSYCYPLDSGASTVFGDYAWHAGNSGDSTHVVGTAGSAGGTSTSGNANALGIYDMSGNVNEWCFDLIYLQGRVWRGGSYLEDDNMLRLGELGGYVPYMWGIDLGFRIARSDIE